MPRARLNESVTPPDMRARRAHAVCDGVLSPWPLCDTFAVGQTGLTPSAIGVLFRLYPIHGAANVWRRDILSDGAQTGEDRPGAVNIIHSPPAIPTSILLLILLDEGRAPRRQKDGSGRSRGSRAFRDSARPVGRTRVEQGSVIRKGNIIEDDLVVVDIVGAPPPSDPCMETTHRHPRRIAARCCSSSGSRTFAKRHQHRPRNHRHPDTARFQTESTSLPAPRQERKSSNLQPSSFVARAARSPPFAKRGDPAACRLPTRH